ncbi:MAG: MFS transporter [Oscillospiraceae bacterium]|jgi:OFA family oxalate/formate antiporter-like MFS transporter|nr:MFS transporter [Oscillospiraceae bacterium]
MKVNQTERWLRLLFAVAVLLFAGVIYSWSVLKAPFTAAPFNWDAAELSWNYTITIIAFCLGGFIGGLLTGKTKPVHRLLTAAVLLFFGFFLTSRLSGENVTQLYLTYGVLSGLGVGFAYTTVIGLTAAWFPDKKGLCSGILLMAFGLTTLVVGGTAKRLFGTESFGWSKTYLLLAIVIGVLFAIAAFVLRAPKPGTVFPEAKKPSAKQQSSGRDYGAGEMVKTSAFWLVFTEVALIAAIGSAAIALAGDILGGEFKVESPAAIIGVISVLNGVGRLVSGALFDKFGAKKTQFVTIAVVLAAPAVMVCGILAKSGAVGIAGLSLCYFSYGFAPTISSVFTSAFFGTKNFTRNFGIMNLLLVPAPFAAILSGAIYKSTDSFRVPFLILTGVAAVAAVVNLLIMRVKLR